MSVPPHGLPEDQYRRRWWTLAVLTLSLVLVVMANSSLNIAMPTFVKELGTTDTELQWIIDSYALVFGGLLLTMGALGDRFGRKGALQAGLLVFGVAALLAALFASEPWHLITVRAAMGLGGALVMPATLSILTTVFPREERGKAIGIWAAFAGLGGIIGILSSGWLLEHFAWKSIFWLNVPVVALALAAGARLVPTSRDPREAPIDLVGSLLSIFALGGLLYAIIEGPNAQWTSPLILGVGAVSLVLAVAFVAWERRTPHPMLPMSFFKVRGFNAGLGAIALVFFAMFATFFVLTQYIQFILGYSPLEAGLRFLPLGLGMVAGAPNSDRLAKKFGARVVVTTGLVIASLGLASLALVSAATPYEAVAVTLFALGLGMGFAMAPATGMVMSSIPARKAGVGSSMNDTAREVGGAFGIAVLGTILKDTFSAGLRERLADALPPAMIEQAAGGLGNAFAVARAVGGPQAPLIVEAARASFLEAMAPSFWVASAFALLAAGLVAVWFPRASAVDLPVDEAAPATGTP